MNACLTKFSSSQAEGDRSYGSSYPESEAAYFKRVYGSDRLKQLHDDHQEEAILRYCKPNKRRELIRVMHQLSNLKCSNDPKMHAPGRSAYSLKLLAANLDQYCQPKARSLRWNEHYQQALASVAKDVRSLLPVGRFLKPMTIHEVASSAAVQRNLKKNAGYMAFESSLRSKGENLPEAVEWCNANMHLIAESGAYGIPLVISHRSSNSKPKGDGTWKWKCRIILMQDVRALLMDGRFLVSFTELFKDIPWGEGSMNHQQVSDWIQRNRQRYSHFYSSDYSSFDVSQPAWLLEDVFRSVVRPVFGSLSAEDEALFDAMVYSYIHKEIHAFDGVRFVVGCQLSGSLATYALNTIVNEVIDRTVLLMQGCDICDFVSLKCGDDNLTYYNGRANHWNADKHCELIKKYFGITTTMGIDDYGPSSKDPTFLSRVWTFNGAERDINEVIWNLVYPERFRDYRPDKTHVNVRRAEALVLLSSCLEQEATMRRFFDISKIEYDAGIRRGDDESTYKALASMGSGFNDPWINFKFGNLKISSNFVA